MLKKFSILLTTYYLLLTTGYLSPVHARIPDWTGTGTKCHTPEKPAVYDDDTDDVATIRGIECIVSNLLNITITVIGLAVFAMLILGAFQFLTSGGDPKAVEAARGTITYAILGLILAIAAWFILVLIADFTGTRSGPFNILQFSTQVP